MKEVTANQPHLQLAEGMKMEDHGTTMTKSILEFRSLLADEVRTLQDSPNAKSFSSDIKLLRQLAAKLSDVATDIESLQERTRKLESEALTAK